MSSEKKKIYKPSPVSGFPEWLPEVRMVEQSWLDHIRRVFESYGFCSIETPAVEELAVIAAKGEDVDKEIYVLERLQADPDEKKDARLGLHFDQTVPMARYVAQHFSDLVFPFKRYQMQKVWRGERPQMGRMREFYQCDIDVVHVDSLPLHFDAEVAAVMYEVVAGLPGVNLGRVQLKVSNRKILMSYLKSIGASAEQCIKITNAIDKIHKIDLPETYKIIGEIANDEDQIELIKKFILISFQPYALSQFNLLEERLRQELLANIVYLDTYDETFEEGIQELAFVLDNLSHLPEGAVVADLSIVRGLDYYTGTVYETQLLDVPEFTGSVCSGGRYDDLAGNYINKHLPGVGISLGFTRLFDVMRQNGRLKVGAKGPADILVVMPSEERRALTAETAQRLRACGHKVEQYHAPQKVGKQLAYAEKKGIPFVWFPPFEDGLAHEVKNMATGEQSQADPAEWKKA